MGKYEIKGGIRLQGKIRAESAKNSVLPMLTACLLTRDTVTIKNCPDISDVTVMLEIIKSLGGETERNGKDVSVRFEKVKSNYVKEELSEKLRASIFFLGALIPRTGGATVCSPGGCRIGKRPVDVHIEGLRALGVSVREREDGKISATGCLKGNDIRLSFPSVSATENLLMCACLAKGRTVIKNCAREPEVRDFAEFLNSMGAKIYGAGKSTVIIDGVKELHGTEYLPTSDRIEVGTYLVATAMTGGEIEIENASCENIFPLINKLCNNTCNLKIKNDIIYYKSGGRFSSMKISTGPFPEFPTDLQAQISALCCIADGRSYVIENVFENRFLHLTEMKKMGAKINVVGKTAVIDGTPSLCGAEVFAGDLRGGAGLCLCALSAEGKSIVHGTEFVRRGYADFVNKLKSLGADITEKD